MKWDEDLSKVRKRILEEKPSNVLFLLAKRFRWMNKFLKGKKLIYELGCGSGLSKQFINNTNLTLTDITNNS